MKVELVCDYCHCSDQKDLYMITLTGIKNTKNTCPRYDLQANPRCLRTQGTPQVLRLLHPAFHHPATPVPLRFRLLCL